MVVALYALWQLAGNLATGGFRQAIVHAWWIWHTERTLRLPSELDVQRLLLPHPLLSEIANIYYATMHFGMLIAMLIWMFAWHRDRYPASAQRDGRQHGDLPAHLLHPGRAAAAAVPAAASRTWPRGTASPSTPRSARPAGADQLSAMPSVHVAWSISSPGPSSPALISRWRWLILLHPAVTVFVVVAHR